MKTTSFVLALLCSIYSMASDSIKSMSATQLLQVIKKYHPVAKNATADIQIAKAEITVARGNFDPLLQYKAAEKRFDGINYYREQVSEIRIPAWYGIEVSAALNSLSGSRINPEETSGRIAIAGISVPLAKNLLMDKRRAALAEAKIMNRLAVNEQRSKLNNLYYEALGAWWNWVLYRRLFQVTGEALTANEKRFQWVKKAWQQGDRAAIDTVEAFAQWQSFRYLHNEAGLAMQNALLEVSVFLWNERNEPYLLPVDVQPAEENTLAAGVAAPVLPELIDAALARHPELLEYNFKLDYLQVEKKLKFQELLPALNVQYNQLGKGYTLPKTAAQWPLFENNFRYGVSLSVPLRFSAGRGEYRKAKLKITQTELARGLKRTEITNKIKTAYNEWANLVTQRVIQQQLFESYRQLLKGEETRFTNGESSLFLVNMREQKLLEVQQKLQEVLVKQQKALVTLQWAAGLLGDN